MRPSVRPDIRQHDDDISVRPPFIYTAPAEGICLADQQGSSCMRVPADIHLHRPVPYTGRGSDRAPAPVCHVRRLRLNSYRPASQLHHDGSSSMMSASTYVSRTARADRPNCSGGTRSDPSSYDRSISNESSAGRARTSTTGSTSSRVPAFAAANSATYATAPNSVRVTDGSPSSPLPTARPCGTYWRPWDTRRAEGCPGVIRM